jgi:two-component system chemotaxis sensor kinase CheA
MRRFIDYIVLPKAISDFEASYLRRINRIGLLFFALHIPVMFVIAWGNASGPWLALALTTAIFAGPALAFTTLKNPRSVSITYGVAAMFMGGALVHFGQGPMQIEMHFYFFALIAMLAVFGNPLVIVAAALTVTLHHLVLWVVLPHSVFNYDAPVWVVAVHAAFVVLVSTAACFIARSFFDNVIGLEKIVQARTLALDDRNRDMRLVLDNVSQGFVTIDRNAVASAERSGALDRWFPPTGHEASLFDLFVRGDKDFAARSRLGWAEVTEAVMPLSLTLEQMPSNLVVDDTHYRVAYLPIGEGEEPERFLVVVTDITDEVKRGNAENERREAVELFERLLVDRGVVSDFFEEGASLVEAITNGKTTDLERLKRMLHTLKGNSAIFRLDSLASLCNELETLVTEEETVPAAADLARLRDRWAALAGNIERFMGGRQRVIEIDEAEHAALEQAVRRGASSAALLRMVHSLKLEPTQRRLDHFAEQVQRIGVRLDKSVDVTADGGGLRVDPRHWVDFWGAFIHAVRNAVDHGLESSEERLAHGKSEGGAVALRTYMRGERFVVEISDDGRGIDWASVARKAADLGLPTQTEEDLRLALFHGGVSTADRVTDMSGRGIGMSAVRAAAESRGGEVEIETRGQHGTTLRMCFPKLAMSPDLGASAQSLRPVAAVEIGA